uniref:Angiotensin-converting enzyme n=1 Tax=Lutzomyia ayacuchensis TaxID=252632 RepID=L0MXU9_LUTAY|nr:hypothetical protein [Lutzomyia ayacuchensis]
MRITVIFFTGITIALVSCAVLKKSGETIDEEEARAAVRLKEINEELDRKKNINTLASWAYASNITETNLKSMNDVAVETAKYYNCKFWELRSYYGGIEPPIIRSEDDFDPPAKYHISSDVEYLRYLVSFIIQFQFHQAVCEKAGQFVPNDPEKTLLNCDIYQSTEAGNAFKEMLQLGSSKPWPDAMEILTGQRKMDASALIEYFRPLSDWLQKKNKELGAHVGWEKSTKCVKKSG